MVALLLSNDNRLIRAVRDAISPMDLVIRSITPSRFPTTADAVVTLGQISKTTEILAMGLGCYTIVLPEGAAYLREKVRAGELETLAGSDLSRADNYF